MLNVRHLAVFRAVMQMGTVSGAARMLNVSQPAVTKSLQLLEADLKVTLFERIKGRIHPTPDSEILVLEIERLFGALQSVEQAADEVRRGIRGHVKIAAVGNLASSLVSATVARFVESRPLVRIEVQALSTHRVAEEVSNDRVDIGLLDVPFADGYFESIPLCSCQMACIMARNHPLASKSFVEPEDLMQTRIISFAKDTMTGIMLQQAFRQNKLEFPLDIVTNQTMTACELARRGVGVALVDPFPLLPTIPEDLLVMPFKPAIYFHPTIICPPARPVSSAADEFINYMHETMSSMIGDSQLLQKPRSTRTKPVSQNRPRSKIASVKSLRSDTRRS
ncbi:LysR family transcriptional regulator [soil metagenome]